MHYVWSAWGRLFRAWKSNLLCPIVAAWHGIANICLLNICSYHLSVEEARILEWVTIPYPRRSSDPGIEPTSPVPPALASRFFTIVHLGSPNPYPFVLASVQFSPSVVSDCLFSQGLQHARPPCPSTTSGVYSNSCPLSQWCQPTISSSVVPFSSCLQAFPTSGSFQMS